MRAIQHQGRWQDIENSIWTYERHSGDGGISAIWLLSDKVKIEEVA